MEAFYALATEDYRQLAMAVDWPALLLKQAHEGWTLLDVACGSGKFPTALVKHSNLTSVPAVSYDLLDPSLFSVTEAKAALSLPFVAGRELVMTLQDLPADHQNYDVVWATHALYALPPDELDVGMARFIDALAPGGLGLGRRPPAGPTTWRSTTPTAQGFAKRHLSPAPNRCGSPS
jgi:SAM-dependent methyltransferase